MATLHRYHVFISHSQKDKRVVAIVRRAFRGYSKLRPYFLEQKLVAAPPWKEIVERVKGTSALFAFFTRNSSVKDTRDWLVFELAVAIASEKDVYAWKAHTVPRDKVPRFVEQVTTYHDFDVRTRRGKSRLTREVEEAARKVLRKVNGTTT